MRVIDLVSKLRNPVVVEVRVNNYIFAEFNSTFVATLKDEILNREIFEWFVQGKNKIVIDIKEE